MIAVDDLVEAPEERDRLEVLVAAVDVRQPLPRPLGIVEVEHRRDGVDPQPVEVIPVEPVERVADQVVRDLVPAVVEDQRAPVGLVPPAGVRVLVEVGAVEVREAVRVPGEVRRHPIEEDADAPAVERVHEGHELRRRPVSPGRGEGADLLVAPRSVERVLADRQELHVGVAEVSDIVPERLAELAIGRGTGSPARARAATIRGEPRRSRSGRRGHSGWPAPPSRPRRPRRARRARRRPKPCAAPRPRTRRRTGPP